MYFCSLRQAGRNSVSYDASASLRSLACSCGVKLEGSCGKEREALSLSSPAPLARRFAWSHGQRRWRLRPAFLNRFVENGQVLVDESRDAMQAGKNVLIVLERASGHAVHREIDAIVEAVKLPDAQKNAC